MELTIGRPRIEVNEEEGYARVVSTCVFEKWPDAEEGTGEKDFYFEVPLRFRDALVSERVDAFVVGFLPWAMWRSRTQESVTIVCETPISERLLFQIEQTVVPFFSDNFSDRYAPISLRMPVDDGQLERVGAVAATGVSGGVDSTYTILKLTNDNDSCPDFAPALGVVCDFDAVSRTSRETKSDEAVAIAEKICGIYGLDLLDINSNFTEDLYTLAHSAVITFLLTTHILSIQKLVKRYYVGSTIMFSEFEVIPEDVSHFELLLMQYLSTQDTCFYSVGSEVSRFEKTRYLAQFEEPKHYLMPCSASSDGTCCNRCSKCTRTMCTLWCLDKLEDFGERFDVQSFYDDINYHLGYIIMRRDYTYNREILAECKKAGKPVPPSAWIAAFMKWTKRGFKARNPYASSYRPR